MNCGEKARTRFEEATETVEDVLEPSVALPMPVVAVSSRVVLTIAGSGTPCFVAASGEQVGRGFRSGTGPIRCLHVVSKVPVRSVGGGAPVFALGGFYPEGRLETERTATEETVSIVPVGSTGRPGAADC